MANIYKQSVTRMFHVFLKYTRTVKPSLLYPSSVCLIVDVYPSSVGFIVDVYPSSVGLIVDVYPSSVGFIVDIYPSSVGFMVDVFFCKSQFNRKFVEEFQVPGKVCNRGRFR